MTDRTVRYCVHCGDKVYHGQIYCPSCGKLNLAVKQDRDSTQRKKPYRRQPVQVRRDISRKCSGCGSVISSTILEQCPICDELLEVIPEEQKKASQAPQGLVFLDRPRSGKGFLARTDKKDRTGLLVPEESLILKKDSWKFKEGLNVFTNCLMVYITLELLILMILWMGIDPEASLEVEMNIYTIVLSQVPGIFFGVYAIGYIISNKHVAKKLGLNSKSSKLTLAILIGAVGAFGLLGINLFSNFINIALNDLGLSLVDVATYIADENQIIIDSGLLWIFLLGGVLILYAISIEIVYRGVLHNTLKERFGNSPLGRIKVILIVSLIYSSIYLLFSFPVGIIFFLLNFLLATLLGILYEITDNLYTTIVANCTYNVLLLIVIIFF